MYLFGENYYAGISVPNLLMTKHLERQDGIIADGVEAMHYFITGGYVFTFNGNDNFKLKPAFMAKAVSGAPLSIDFTTNSLILLSNQVLEFYHLLQRLHLHFSSRKLEQMLRHLLLDYAWQW